MHRKRWLSPGLWENEEVLGLTDAALRVWLGVWSVSDRNGVFPWRPKKWVLRFAPRTSEDPDDLFQQLLDAGLIEKFEASGEWYGFSVKWWKHQDPHIDEAPVYPMPNSLNFRPCPPRHWTKRNAKWMVEVYGLSPRADTGVSTSAPSGPTSPRGSGGSPSHPSCPSSTTCPSEVEKHSAALGEPAPQEDASSVFVWLPCAGTGPAEFPITGAMLQEWGAAFPGINPLAEARKMRLWLLASPKNHKTFQGMGRWVLAWLSNAQDQPRKPSAFGKGSYYARRPTEADEEYLAELKRKEQEG